MHQDSCQGVLAVNAQNLILSIAMSDASDNLVNPIPGDNPSPEPAETEDSDVSKLVDQLIRAKRITYSQYQTLSKMVLADGTVDEHELQQINRLFDAIQAGAVRIMD